MAGGWKLGGVWTLTLLLVHGWMPTCWDSLDASTASLTVIFAQHKTQGNHFTSDGSQHAQQHTRHPPVWRTAPLITRPPPPGCMCCVGFITCSAKALSKYTDMVDSISREQLTKLAEATDAARLALKQVGGGVAARGMLHGLCTLDSVVVEQIVLGGFDK